MRWFRVLAATTVLLSPSFGRAGIIVSEQFQYGPTAGALAGQNGGIGFSTAWGDGSIAAIPWQYTPTGLSLGSLDTSGGAATWANTAIPPNGDSGVGLRPFTTSLGGIIYGAFLFRVNDQKPVSSGLNNTAGLLLGGPTDLNNPSFSVQTPEFAQNAAGLRMEGSSSLLSGNALSLGTTYLALFKFDSVGTAASGWVLNLGQYENFAPGGLTESALNAASLGSGATQVWERTSFDPTVTLDPMSHLLLMGAFARLDVTMDEIRFSNTSLAEAAPQAVPEPSSLLLAGIGALGLVRAHRKRNRRST